MSGRIAFFYCIAAIAAGEPPHLPTPLKGLEIKVEKHVEICDLQAMRGDFLDVHYSTKIAKSSKTGKRGKEVDTTKDLFGTPFSLQLGSEAVLEGWDHAMQGMCEGEIRALTIQPELAYGKEGWIHEGLVRVPGGATLAVQVEMVKIKRVHKQSVYVPKDCRRKSATGDALRVAYKASIHQTSISGEKWALVRSSDIGGFISVDFVLGEHRVVGVIPGWDQALQGMCVGEKMELVVPPEFGYGDKGHGEKIPPKATLYYDIELLDSKETHMFLQMDTNGDAKIDTNEIAAFMEMSVSAATEILEQEDKNKDGFIDWHEAPFPKGDRPPEGVAFDAKQEL